MNKFLHSHHRFFRCVCLYLVSCFFIQPVLAQTPNVKRETMQQQNQERILESVPSLREQTDRGMKGIPSKSTGGMSGSGGLLGGLTEQRIKVHVLGDVINPGVYTVAVSDRLTDVLDLAVPKRSSQRVVQIRHFEEKTRSFDLYRYLYRGDLNHNPFLQDNDVIFLPTQPGAVRVEGPVGRDGIFELNGERSLQGVVDLVGGFTAGVARTQAIKIIRVNEFGQKFTFDVAVEKKAMRDFMVAKGDVIIVPDLLNKTGKFDYSIETLPGETVFYPTARPDVFVVGAVSSAGAYPYKSHLTVKDYVGFAGATAESRLSTATLIRGGKRKNVKMSASLNPGDMVVVKTRQINNISTIMGFASAIIGLTLSTIVLRDQFK